MEERKTNQPTESNNDTWKADPAQDEQNKNVSDERMKPDPGAEPGATKIGERDTTTDTVGNP